MIDLSLRRKVPVLLQTEVAECGLACIAMVSQYMGSKLDLRTLRAQASVSQKGLSLDQLMHVADEFGLATRALRLELDELNALRLPAILHWDLNHYVVLTKVKASGIEIHDPAAGKKRLGLQEVSQHFTGVALELTRSEAFVAPVQVQKFSVWQLWTRLSHFYQTLGLLLLLSLVIQATAILGPYYMQWVIDHVIVSGDGDLLKVLAIGFGLLSLWSACVSSLRSWLILRVASVMNLTMGTNLLNHLLKLPLAYFQKRHVGDIVSRFGSLNQVRERLTTGVVETVVDGVMSVAMLVVMVSYSGWLTLLVCAATLGFMLLRAVTYGHFFRLNDSVIRTAASEQTNFLENIRGIQTIKMFGVETLRLGLWQNRYTSVINSEIALGKLNIVFGFLSGLIFGLENILVIYFAAKEVLATHLTVGMLFAFVAYKSQFSARAQGLVEQWIAFRMLRLHLDRIADIALESTESLDASSSGADITSATLELSEVGFAYGQNEREVVQNINLTIPTGAMVAIVGASGSGKSTLLKLIAGLIEPTRGTLLCNGLSTKQLGLRRYRKLVAAVMQDDQLLSGNVQDNLCLFDAEPDLERMQECARTAGIEQEILSLPMGYQSLVGDMGSVFSGGQTQRLLLARALYREPEILLLDEATCHLDRETEARVWEAICAADMTRVVIAHSPQLVAHADVIWLVDEGTVRIISWQEYSRLVGANFGSATVDSTPVDSTATDTTVDTPMDSSARTTTGITFSTEF